MEVHHREADEVRQVPAGSPRDLSAKVNRARGAGTRHAFHRPNARAIGGTPVPSIASTRRAARCGTGRWPRTEQELIR
ncbi:hypothetical protein BGLA2_140044 [Burkholderia gladioli]|nr:hypothetical protein BGLA2_140044 [Burkholderia gladioli]